MRYRKRKKNIDETQIENIIKSVNKVERFSNTYEVIVHPDKDLLEKEEKEYYEEVPIILMRANGSAPEDFFNSVENVLLKYKEDEYKEDEQGNKKRV